MSNSLLGVNVDHVATLRQQRFTSYPDVVAAAQAAECGGADLITVHLREDRRHIQDMDVIKLKEVLNVRLNLESAITADMLTFAQSIKPAECCLVPERRNELTTEGGLNVLQQQDKIRQACNELASAGIRVSLFIDADLAQIDAAIKCGAPVIELHTGHYADAAEPQAQQQELIRIITAVKHAQAGGLRVNAGHGLHYHNTQAIAAIPGIHELNIGHSIVARAIFVGMETAVREMKTIISNS